MIAASLGAMPYMALSAILFSVGIVGLLTRRKDGTRVFYALADPQLPTLLTAAERALKAHLRGRLGGLEP